MSVIGRTTRQRAGLTLIEAVLAMTIVPIAVLAIALAVTAGQAQSVAALRQGRATLLAEALMEEILALPYADTEAMQMHLEEISCRVGKGAHAVLLLDRAGWHTTDRLNVPKNMTLIFLPSRAPELNPVENVWQYLRANWLSNRVFETYDDIINAACAAWNKLTAAPDAITSIAMRDWAHVGHS